MNHGQKLKILLIEDNPGDALLIRKMLSTAPEEFDVAHAVTLADGFELLRSAAFDLLLLDLGLPDSVGLETLDSAFAVFPHLPIIVFTGLADEVAGFEAIHRGAQDYLIKAEVDTRQLMRSIRYSMGRKIAEENLRKNEEFVRNILESVGEGLVVIDRDYRIISANRAYCSLVKLPLEGVIGRQCHEISHHKSRPCYLAGEECAPFNTFNTGLPHMVTHTHYDKDNNPSFIETKSYPLKDASGRINAVIETLNNITEKKTLEDQLRHSQRMEAVGTLAGGIAHDFNNMLNVIIGYGELMQMRMTEDDPVRPHLLEIIKAGERAAQLTKGLLAFSRKQVLDMRPECLNKIIDGFRKMLSRIIGEDIRLRIALSDEDLTIMADSSQLEQILMNLAANARDAMPHGGDLTIKTEAVVIDSAFIHTHGFGEPGGYALVTISDTGGGIDPNTLERIFEPYFTTKDMGRGTGLGLSIVYGIVKQHNGHIRCSSVVGEGTSFGIYLPIAISKPDTGAMRVPAAPAGGTETILLAEDDPGLRRLASETLAKFGYKVVEAADGNEAVRKFRQHSGEIRLLLFDMIMPEKDGRKAYEEITAIRHDVKALFMSGYAPDIIEKRGGMGEGIEFISKPVALHTLLEKVRTVLDG